MKSSSKILTLSVVIMAAALAFTGYGMPVLGLIFQVVAVLVGLIALFFLFGHH